jgi:predicted alpha/beta-hydrolase family hydrolase
VTLIERRPVETPVGTARIEQHRPQSPWALLALTHGAGGGIDAPDLQALARALPRVGVTVTLVEQPWRVAGKRIAGPPASLDEGYQAVVSSLRSRTPLFVGGRSAGARVGCRTGRGLGAVGVVALAFPLYPPGRPERSRAHELSAHGLPVLVVQGTRDPFGSPVQFPPTVSLVAVPGADHSLKVPRRAPVSPQDVEALLVESAVAWLRRRLRRR